MRFSSLKESSKQKIREAMRPFAVRFPQAFGWNRPRFIAVEPTNSCMLKCPVCATAKAMTRPKGNMSQETFDLLLRQITWRVELLNFAFAGEPLINRRMFDMILRAHERGLSSAIETNGMLLENVIDDIFRSHLGRITISLDGTNQEMLQQYRVGADFDKIYRGLKRLTETKRRQRAPYPIIRLQHVVMKQNEAHLSTFMEMARELGVDEVFLKSFNAELGDWMTPEEKRRNAEAFVPIGKEFSRYADLSKVTEPLPPEKQPLCPFPMSSCTVLWNGDVVLCCIDFDASNILGNIHQTSLGEIWGSRRYAAYRRKVFNRELAMCKTCDFTMERNKVIPIATLSNGKWKGDPADGV